MKYLKILVLFGEIQIKVKMLKVKLILVMLLEEPFLSSFKSYVCLVDAELGVAIATFLAKLDAYVPSQWSNCVVYRSCRSRIWWLG
jgi:hypothetical protein